MSTIAFYGTQRYTTVLRCTCRTFLLVDVMKEHQQQTIRMCFEHTVCITLQLNVLTHEVTSDHSTTALSPLLVHWQ